jgi:hypothetical protein
VTCTVWVIDTSALINCKRAVPGAKQWELFEHLKELVVSAALCFPRQVTEELRNTRHVDTPEAWALHVAPMVVHAYDPDPSYIARVMELAGDVIEPDAEDDPADPYVLGQALAVRDLGHFPCIVTDDAVDRPAKISMTTACGRFDPPLPFLSLDAFLRALGFNR